MLEARRATCGLVDPVLHLVSGCSSSGSAGGYLCEQRVRLQRQVVHRQMRGRVGQRRFEVGTAFCKGLLPGSAYIRSRFTLSKLACGDVDGTRAPRARIVDAAQRLEMRSH